MTQNQLLGYEKGGSSLVAPCAELLVFSSASLREGAEGFKAFYECFRARWGQHVKFYLTNTMQRPKRVTAQTLDTVPLWLQDERALKEMMIGMDLHGGKSAQDMRPPAFEMFCVQRAGVKPHAYFRITLPLDWLQQDPRQLVELVHTALATFPLSWGYAGCSLLWDEQDVEEDEQAAEHLHNLLKDHPGLSYGNPMAFVNPSLKGGLDLNWLTLLGPELAARLGGRESLVQQVPAEVAVEPVGQGGLLMRAGAMPVWDASASYEAYRSVGRALGPVRAPDAVRQLVRVWPIDKSEKGAWFDRFFT